MNGDQVDISELPVIDDVGQFAAVVVQWHADFIQNLQLMVAGQTNLELEMPDGTKRMATVEEDYGFRRGLTHVIESLQLPFIATVAYDIEPSTNVVS